MSRSPSDIEALSPRTRLVVATLDLLRRGGLTGAGINQIVDASRAPKGSVYHYFPGGKRQIVIEALREAERTVGENFYDIFRDKVGTGDKVRTLFTRTAAVLEANQFGKCCPVAAVTLDLDQETEALRQVCHQVFGRWVDVIAQGLDDVPHNQRRPVAQFILATLEGALILGRASASKAPLLESGTALAAVLEAGFPVARRAPRT